MAEDEIDDRVNADAEGATRQVGFESQIEQQVVIKQIENGQNRADRHERE